MTTINAEQLSGALFQEDTDYMVDILKNKLPLPWDAIGTSVKVPHSQKEGYSSVYVNQYCHEHNNDKPIGTIHPSVKTLPDMFALCVKLYGENDCLGERPYDKVTKTFADYFVFENYLTVTDRFTKIGAGIFKLLLDNPFRTELHNVDDFILTIYSRNRSNWLITDLACQHYSICNTSLYDTLGPHASSYILNLTESPIVVCSKEKLDTLLELKKDSNLATLISVVSMDDLEDEDDHYYSLFHEVGVQLVDFSFLEALGAENPIPYKKPNLDTLYTISFTSGTTGPPKGVLIPQSMALALMAFCAVALRRTSTGKQSYTLSFLPLAHIYERMNALSLYASGGGLGFPHDGLPTSLIENVKILKPSILACVPRVYSKFEAAIKDKLHDGGLLMTIASNTIKKKEEIQASKDDAMGKMFLRDRLIIRKFEEALGFTNIDYMVTGSAPMSNETTKFLKLALNSGFSQGYGLTESFAGCALSYPYEKDPGSSGPISIACEMKLRDIPEMNYYSKNPHEPPKGELLLRGYQIFPGYFKNQKLTEELFDEDGWFRTGDVAVIDEKGRIHIIDRVKNFFKLAQGEYITPERIENIYLSQAPLLTQLYVHGDSFQNYLVAIVGIDPVQLRKLIKQKRLGTNLFDMNDKDLLGTFNRDPQLKRIVLENLNHCVRHEGLQGFEKIHNLHLAVDPLRVEDDVVTPTLKIKRSIAKKKFEDVFERLYKEGSLIKKSKL